MNDKVITLPASPEEIIQRLRKVQNDDLANALYKRIAKKAGQELVADGVVNMFALNIHTTVTEDGYQPFFINLMLGFIPAWIDALIDDKEVAEEAKRTYQEARDVTSKK